MNIGSGNGYPSAALSNFSPHPFTIDEITCNSMEGFLQSLKFSNPEMQKVVCLMVGMQAKHKGMNKKWWKTQTLWWRGVAIGRHTPEYQGLLDRAYAALALNTGFRAALLATGSVALTHSIGKSDPHHTVLTEREFCSRLEKIRTEIKKESKSG
jgi:predicted NAD-dependent protein-ADP-ribosyltransferase YbiA (DUF1768 family)